LITVVSIRIFTPSFIKSTDMKKIIVIAAIIVTTLNATAQQAGHVRIAFAGFKCLRETADDILHLDGKADEVFFRFYFTIADNVGNTKLKYANQSDTYGDNYGPFSNRINAGSAVDLFGNLKGGIKGGDNYSCNNIIGEYDLAGGDVLTVMPTIWEWDPGSGLETTFNSSVEVANNTINQKASALSNQRFGTGISNAIGSGQLIGLFLVDGGTFLGIKAILNLADLLAPKPRPIGVALNGEYSPQAVLLNANVMQQIASSNFGYGQGVIPVQYNEEALGNARDHGNYIVLLKVDFTPSATTTAPPSNTNNTTPPSKSKTMGGIKTMGGVPPAAGSIAGSWVGTYGTGQNNTPSYYSFKLNADGTMQVVGANNSVIANGTYSFSNNQLTGKYTYSNGGAFSFAATLSGSQLNGTWGSGTNVSGGGKWVMNKAAVSATGNIR
jgi:hypothetical protein